MACGDVLSLEDLQTAKKHQIFEAEVITGKAGGVVGGATIDTATNPVTGQTQQTLPAVIADANADFDAQILNMGFTCVGTFAAGATLTNPRQTLLWDVADGGNGQEYGWSGAFPKVVPAASTPASTGGISVGAWISRFDPALRIQLREAVRRSYADAGLILSSGSFEAGGVITAPTGVLLFESDGKAYSYNGTLPHTVLAGSSPSAEPGMWTDRSSSFLVTNVVNFGAVGDGLVSSASLNTLAIQAAMNSGAAEIFVPDGTYCINDYITLTESVKKIRLSQGATIIQTVDKPIYYKAGNFVGGSIPILGSPIKGSEMVSLNPGTYDHLAVDDWLFIRGSNRTPNVTAGSSVACLRKVKSISADTNVIHIDAPFYRDMGEGSLTRMYKVALGGRVVLEGGTYTSSMNQENFMVLFDFLLCEAPDFIGVTYKDLGAAGLSLTHCVGGQWIDSRISNLRDDQPTGHFGYGVALRGACRGYNFTSGVVHKVRHAITTATATGYTGTNPSNLPLPAGHNDAQTTGEPEACMYGPNVWVYNSTNAAFDCHEQGYGITITPNANGCFDGVLMRCSDVSVIGGQIHNCRRSAIRSDFPASNAMSTVEMRHRVHGTTITNISQEGTQGIGLLLEAVGANVDISDVSITGFATTGIYVDAGVVADINGGVIDAGVKTTQAGIYFAGTGSSVNGTRIRNNKYGIRQINGNNKYRHVTFSGNDEDVSPSKSRDAMNGHTVPLDSFIKGRYYAGSFGAPTTSNVFGNGQFRVHPFTVREQINIDKIAAEVTVAGSAGALLRLGIYNDDGNGYPNALVLDAGTIDATIVGPQEITVSTVLQPGLYWLGAAVQGNPTTVPTLRANSSGSQLVGATSLAAAINSATASYSNTFTGALGATFAGGSNAGGVSPRIAIRIAP